jgi:uncharacterized membrane protein
VPTSSSPAGERALEPGPLAPPAAERRTDAEPSWRGPVLVLSIAGLLFGLLLVVVVPPFQVPDEPHHFYRSFAIAEGRLFAARTATGGGGEVPQSLTEVVRLTLPKPPGKGKFKPPVIRAALGVELASSERVEIAYPGASVYFPHVYLPQALGIALGRLTGAGPLALLYLGRVSGLLGCLALAVAAVRILPVQRWAIAAFSLTPMTMYLRSAVTADSTTIALVLLTIALFVREALATGPLSRASVSGLALASLATALAKPGYLAVSLLFFAIPAARFARPPARWGSAGLVLAVPALACVLWNLHVGALFDLEGVGGWKDVVVDPGEQARRILESPGTWLATIGRTLWPPWRAYAYYRGAVGFFGWLDTVLGDGQIAAISAAVLAIALLDASVRGGLAAWQKALVALVFVLGLLVLLTVLFVTVTPAGSARLGGALQGRYFLPLLPLVLLLLPLERRWARTRLAERVRRSCVIVFASYSGGLTLVTLVGRFLV